MSKKLIGLSLLLSLVFSMSVAVYASYEERPIEEVRTLNQIVDDMMASIQMQEPSFYDCCSNELQDSPVLMQLGYQLSIEDLYAFDIQFFRADGSLIPSSEITEVIMLVEIAPFSYYAISPNFIFIAFFERCQGDYIWHRVHHNGNSYLLQLFCLGRMPSRNNHFMYEGTNW